MTRFRVMPDTQGGATQNYFSYVHLERCPDAYKRWEIKTLKLTSGDIGRNSSRRSDVLYLLVMTLISAAAAAIGRRFQCDQMLREKLAQICFLKWPKSGRKCCT